jgi:hypothetical protein
MRGWKGLVAVACLVAMPGCLRWKLVPIPTPPAPPNVVSNLSRVRLNSGQDVEFVTLVVATDSIFGIRNNDARTRLTISFDQVRRVETREKDPLKTLGFMGALLFGLWYSGAAGLGPNR